MQELKLKQLRYESDAWKRLLSFMMNENVSMKNRIAEVLKNNFNKNLLNELENHQSEFIKEDELIALLRNDVAELDKILEKEIFKDTKIINDLSRKLMLLRNSLLTAEREFSKLKSAFNSFLIENL